MIQDHAKTIDPKVECVVCGSYRRGSKEHSDVDIVLAIPNNEPGEHYRLLKNVVKSLQKASLISEVLTMSSNQRRSDELIDIALVVWSTVPDVRGVSIRHYRVDIICVDWRVVGAAVVGWTGE